MNFLNILRRFVFIFLAFLCWINLGVESLASHFQESGLPHIQTCLPNTFTYVNHFNSIVQGKDGFIYIGARNGIFRYNGQSWKHLPANGDIHLISHRDSIIAYSKNQMFIIPPGFSKEFEMPDTISPFGRTERINSGNYIQIASSGDQLYILTTSGLFLKSQNTLTEIITETRVIRVFPSGEGVNLLTEGMQLLNHDGLETRILKIPGELNPLIDLIPRDDKTLLINGADVKLISENTGENHMVLQEASVFLKKFGYKSAAWLPGGQLVLGTSRGGILLLGTDGEVISQIGLQDGLFSNEARQLLVDATNNLWVLHDHALSRIEIPSPYSIFNHMNGLEGNINELLRHEGNLYAATSHGLFILRSAAVRSAADKLAASIPNAVFQKIEGIDAECHSLESISGGILAGTNTGLFEILDDHARLLFPGHINCLLYYPGKDLLFAGTESGIRIIKTDDWSEIKNFALPKISIDDIELSPSDFLWLSSRSGTLYRSNKPLSDPGNLVCESYTADQFNSPTGSFISLIRTPDDLRFSTINGLMVFDHSTNSFLPDTSIAFPLKQGSFRISLLEEDQDKNLWIYINSTDSKNNHLWLACPDTEGIFKASSFSSRRWNNRIINCINIESDGIIWVGTRRGLIRYNSSLEIEKGQVPRTYISNIISENASGNKREYLNAAISTTGSGKMRRIKIPNSNNNIHFEILSTDFNCESGPQYQYRLAGLNDEWSEWSNQNRIVFNGLKKGRFEFQVRSRNVNDIPSETVSFPFRIKAPIYGAWYALLIYFMMVLVIIWYYRKWNNLQQIKGQFHLEEVVQERTESLIKEKEKTEDLLANILPKTTADELKAGGKASTSKFKMCTVLFADIQGFTKIAEEMNPDKLIDQLDKFYYQFDSVVEKYNIEKIKTIGDAYMAAGGIPVKNRTNPVDVVLAALEMQKYMRELRETKSDIWDLRIGIHTGSVIAGVVGQKKYSYDIWGDSVNTASRMESSGEVGKVNISATTYKLIKDFFQCEFRGKMPVKYKGDIAMFFVNGLNPTYSEADKFTPNEKFNVQIQLLRLLDLEEVILEKLEKELPEDLFFHNVEHTSHVYSQVELLGRGEKVGDEDLLLLQTAALLHDIGYITDMEGHEENSVKYAREILPVYRYSEEQIEKVCKLILATSMPPKPENLLEQIICDANLDHLGRVDFLIQSDKLFQEYRMRHKIRSKKDWNQYQVDFLKSHEFYTDVANKMREISKEQQIENIRQFS